MRNSELRKEYLIEQAITYVTVGLFLITYASDTSTKASILIIGTILCIFALASIIIASTFTQLVYKMVLISNGARFMLLPLASLALFMSVVETRDKGFLELRFWIAFVWICFAAFSMAIGLFKGKGIFARMKPSKGKRGIAYQIFAFVGIITSLLGIYLIIIGTYYPDTSKALADLNKWSYDPMVWLAIALVCVFPILILTPDCDNKDDESKS